MDRKIKIGVLGGYRGSSMINYCERADNVEIVAICDKSAEVLNCQREKLKDENITYFDNFEDFIKHDMDAVVLANYANEHAPFAVRALKQGLHQESSAINCSVYQVPVFDTKPICTRSPEVA